jgi:hypothetical protein
MPMLAPKIPRRGIHENKDLTSLPAGDFGGEYRAEIENSISTAFLWI